MKRSEIPASHVCKATNLETIPALFTWIPQRFILTHAVNRSLVPAWNRCNLHRFRLPIPHPSAKVVYRDGKPVVVVGSDTAHGGVVIEGDPALTIA